MVPYQDFACADGNILIALGNDRQFAAFTRIIGQPGLAEDPRFASVAGRTTNREPLLDCLRGTISSWEADELLARMRSAGLPAGRINEIPAVLDHPQIKAREMPNTIRRADDTEVKFLGFPAKLSATPVNYRYAPPRCGEDTASILEDALGLDADAIEDLHKDGIVASGS